MQFPHNLVRQIEKTASKPFRSDAQADATDASFVVQRRVC